MYKNTIYGLSYKKGDHVKIINLNYNMFMLR